MKCNLNHRSHPAASMLLATISAALLLVLNGCGNKSADAPPPAPPPKVIVSRPGEEIMSDILEYTGRIEAVEEAEVRARARGILQKVYFQEGAEVAKDALLYDIDPSEHEANYQQAKADVARLLPEQRRAELEAERATKLKAQAAVSQQQFEQAIAERDAALGNLERARAALRLAELNLSYTKVRAPIAGKVGRTLVTEGNLVGYGEPTLLTTVVALDDVYVYFEVPERDFLGILRGGARVPAADGSSDEGMKVLVGLETESGYPHEGRIDFFNNRVDPETGTILLRGRMKNSQRKLLPGLFARVRLPVGEPTKRLTVPDPAMGADQRGRFVFVVNPDDTVEKRPIEIQTRLSRAGTLVIEKGLSPEDRVIVSGTQRARHGMKVAPEEAPPNDAGANAEPPVAAAAPGASAAAPPAK